MEAKPLNQDIGTFNEGNLHSSLKHLYATHPSQVERPVDGYIVDVARDDRIIEIQTSGFGSLRSKLPALSKNNKVTLVHPIAERKTIAKLQPNGTVVRRLSPKRGNLFDIFLELVSMPTLVDLQGLELDVLLVHEEEIREFDGSRGRRRRGWVVRERRLREVLSTHTFHSSRDLLNVLRPGLPDLFTTEDLAQNIGRNRSLAQKAAYCLRLSNVIEVVSKRGNSLVYQSCY